MSNIIIIVHYYYVSEWNQSFKASTKLRFFCNIKIPFKLEDRPLHTNLQEMYLFATFLSQQKGMCTQNASALTTFYNYCIYWLDSLSISWDIHLKRTSFECYYNMPVSVGCLCLVTLLPEAYLIKPCQHLRGKNTDHCKDTQFIKLVLLKIFLFLFISWDLWTLFRSGVTGCSGVLHLACDMQSSQYTYIPIYVQKDLTAIMSIYQPKFKSMCCSTFTLIIFRCLDKITCSLVSS